MRRDHGRAHGAREHGPTRNEGTEPAICDSSTELSDGARVSGNRGRAEHGADPAGAPRRPAAESANARARSPADRREQALGREQALKTAEDDSRSRRLLSRTGFAAASCRSQPGGPTTTGGETSTNGTLARRSAPQTRDAHDATGGDRESSGARAADARRRNERTAPNGTVSPVAMSSSPARRGKPALRSWAARQATRVRCGFPAAGGSAAADDLAAEERAPASFRVITGPVTCERLVSGLSSVERLGVGCTSPVRGSRPGPRARRAADPAIGSKPRSRSKRASAVSRAPLANSATARP